MWLLDAQPASNLGPIRAWFYVLTGYLLCAFFVVQVLYDLPVLRIVMVKEKYMDFLHKSPVVVVFLQKTSNCMCRKLTCVA